MEQYLLKQASDKQCGNMVTRMLLAKSFHNYEFLRLMISEDLDNFLKIKQFCDQYGLALQGRKIEDFDQFYKKKGLMIIQTRCSNHTHFMLIRKYRKGYIVNDPGFGCYYTSREKIYAEMTGYYLCVIGKTPQYKKVLDSDRLIKRPFIFSQLFTFVIFHIFSLLALVLGVFAFNQPQYLHYAIILSAFSFIFFVFSRQRLFYMNSQYDDAITPLLDRGSSSTFLCNFQALHELKHDLFTPFITHITSALNSLMILGIIAINDLKLLVVPLFIIIGLTLAKRRRLKDNDEYRHFDRQLESVSEQMKRSEGIAEINRRTKSFIQRKFIIDTIFNISIFFILLIMMFINRVYTVNYLLFYLFMMLFLKHNFSQLWSIPASISRYYTALIKIDTIARKE